MEAGLTASHLRCVVSGSAAAKPQLQATLPQATSQCSSSMPDSIPSLGLVHSKLVLAGHMVIVGLHSQPFLVQCLHCAAPHYTITWPLSPSIARSPFKLALSAPPTSAYTSSLHKDLVCLVKHLACSYKGLNETRDTLGEWAIGNAPPPPPQWFLPLPYTS